MKCHLCGEPILGSYYSASEGPVCSIHVRCIECAEWHVSAEDCLLSRVHNATVATTRARAIRAEMRAVGIELPLVPIHLRSALPEGSLGRCVMGVGPGLLHWVSAIEIRRGLGTLRFGHALVHEWGHAFLHCNSAVKRSDALEEGFCEMLAAIWLGSTASFRNYARDMFTGSDPIYSDGFRQMYEITMRFGVPQVQGAVLVVSDFPELESRLMGGV